MATQALLACPPWAEVQRERRTYSPSVGAPVSGSLVGGGGGGRLETGRVIKAP